MGADGAPKRSWTAQIGLAAVSVALGLLLVLQLRAQSAGRPVPVGEDWAFVVADLVEGNSRLRQEIDALEPQVAGLESAGEGGGVLQSLVDQVNLLRVANGQVEVSGPGIEVVVSGPASVLDLQDLVNELRNAGAEALALGGRRLVAWSAIGNDGHSFTVDGWPVVEPYHLAAIGDDEALEAALTRPGGVISLMQEARTGVSVAVARRARLTLPVCGREVEFRHARPEQ